GRPRAGSRGAPGRRDRALLGAGHVDVARSLRARPPRSRPPGDRCPPAGEPLRLPAPEVRRRSERPDRPRPPARRRRRPGRPRPPPPLPDRPGAPNPRPRGGDLEMSLRALVALAMLGAPVAGCASVVPQVPSAVGHVPRTIDGPANPPPRGVA